MLELEIRGPAGAGKSWLMRSLRDGGLAITARADSYDVADRHIYDVRAHSVAVVDALRAAGASWAFGTGRRIIVTLPARDE